MEVLKMKTKLAFIWMLSMLIMAGCSKKVTKTPAINQEPMKKPIETMQPEKTFEEEMEMIPEEKARPTNILNFNNINFDYDKYELTPSARDILSQHARILKQNPDVKIRIEGHCDERGTIEYNLALGERRANAVKTYLVKYGLNENRFSTISYGKERPLDNNRTPDAWVKNRRAAFVITYQ